VIEKILVLSHGFNVRDNGAKTTDLFREPAEALGFRVVEADRGFEFLASARSRFQNEKRAREIVEKLDVCNAGNGDETITGLGHSDGCRKLLNAAWLRPVFDRLIFINPALDRRAPIPPEVRRVDVWHCPGDLAVTLSKCLLFHAWGDMGSVGYAGTRVNVRNHNAIEVGGKHGFEFPTFRKHSRIFERLDLFAPSILAER
jgi:hypothetical protein